MYLYSDLFSRNILKIQKDKSQTIDFQESSDIQIQQTFHTIYTTHFYENWAANSTFFRN